MSDQKDTGIKLFGRVIPLDAEAEDPVRVDQQSELPPPAAAVNEVQHKEKEEKEHSEMEVHTPHEDKDNVNVDITQEEKETEMGVEKMKVNAPQEMGSVELDMSATLDQKKANNEMMNNAEDKATPDPKEENEKTANGESGQDKTLKKPDKIIPCPRCNSMDTKFCYYNNYNVNQPRHFCKNCQRYWTAGGSMRNVPVGAGRRKSKNSSLHHRQILVAPECMMGSRVDVSRTLHPEALASPSSTPIQATSRNETVLKFGPEAPFCESMVSALNIEEQNVTNSASAPQGQNKEANTCSSSVTSYSGPSENTAQFGNNGAPVYCNGVTPVPQYYYLGAPFMYPWSVGWNNLPVMVPGRSMPQSASPSEGCSASSAPWINSPMMPPSRLPVPAFPYPVMPPALWGCLPGWQDTAWNVPCIRPNGLSPSPSSNNSCSGNGSPTLGKHSRDSNPLKEDKETSLWVPKTLRIDDPDEAAKSSIWATLGIKPGDPGAFKPFQSKVESKGQKTEAAPVLQANPAALSRSQSFQENS